MIKQFLEFKMSGVIATPLEFKFTGEKGRPLLKFGLFVNQNGGSDYFNITAWDNTAKYIIDRLEKGDTIYFEANLKGSFYKDGEKNKYAMTILLKDVIAFEKKKSELTENEQ